MGTVTAFVCTGDPLSVPSTEKLYVSPGTRELDTRFTIPSWDESTVAAYPPSERRTVKTLLIPGGAVHHKRTAGPLPLHPWRRKSRKKPCCVACETETWPLLHEDTVGLTLSEIITRI